MKTHDEQHAALLDCVEHARTNPDKTKLTIEERAFLERDFPKTLLDQLSYPTLRRLHDLHVMSCLLPPRTRPADDLRAALKLVSSHAR